MERPRQITCIVTTKGGEGSECGSLTIAIVISDQSTNPSETSGVEQAPPSLVVFRYTRHATRNIIASDLLERFPVLDFLQLCRQGF